MNNTTELSKAELIMSTCKTDKARLNAILDCFTVMRIERQIMALSKTAAFNQEPRNQMIQKYEELDAIMAKYGIKN